MKPSLTLVETKVTGIRSGSVEAELRKLLRQEQELARKLADVRARISPLKRRYMEKHQIFGLGQDALRRDMALRQAK